MNDDEAVDEMRRRVKKDGAITLRCGRKLPISRGDRIHVYGFLNDESEPKQGGYRLHHIDVMYSSRGESVKEIYFDTLGDIEEGFSAKTL